MGRGGRKLNPRGGFPFLEGWGSMLMIFREFLTKGPFLGAVCWWTPHFERGAPLGTISMDHTVRSLITLIALTFPDIPSRNSFCIPQLESCTYYLFTLFTKHQKSIISRGLCRNFVDSVKKVLGGKLIDYLT